MTTVNLAGTIDAFIHAHLLRKCLLDHSSDKRLMQKLQDANLTGQHISDELSRELLELLQYRHDVVMEKSQRCKGYGWSHMYIETTMRRLLARRLEALTRILQEDEDGEDAQQTVRFKKGLQEAEPMVNADVKQEDQDMDLHGRDADVCIGTKRRRKRLPSGIDVELL